MAFARRFKALSWPMIAVYTAVLLVVAGGTIAYAGLSKTVTLVVDGKEQTVRTFGDDVASVLEAQDVKVGLDDRVVPAQAASISDGDTVEVSYARPVTLTVDGQQKTVTTWEHTVDEALAALGVEPESGAFVSRSLDSRVPLKGLQLVVSNPKTVEIRQDDDARRVTSTGVTVADVLEDAGVRPGQEDEVKPALDATLADGDRIRVVDIEVVNRVENVALDHETTVRKDPDAYEGEVEVVTKGKDGKARQQVRYVMADGKKRSRTVVSTKTVREPVTQVEERGTKKPESTSSGDDSVWDRIAKCESGGNWHINTGNGYYGGLQFSAATWHSVGGPGLPHQHSREVQIKYAKILQERSGWGQWSCAAKVGVH